MHGDRSDSERQGIASALRAAGLPHGGDRAQAESAVHHRSLALAASAGDVMLQLGDDELLLGDDGLDQVADRHQAPHLPVVNHG
jgi:hypothetical protein